VTRQSAENFTVTTGSFPRRSPLLDSAIRWIVMTMDSDTARRVIRDQDRLARERLQLLLSEQGRQAQDIVAAIRPWLSRVWVRGAAPRSHEFRYADPRHGTGQRIVPTTTRGPPATYDPSFAGRSRTPTDGRRQAMPKRSDGPPGTRSSSRGESILSALPAGLTLTVSPLGHTGILLRTRGSRST
jgi:hypothetical protein